MGHSSEHKLLCTFNNERKIGIILLNTCNKCSMVEGLAFAAYNIGRDLLSVCEFLLFLRLSWIGIFAMSETVINVHCT